MIIAQFLFDLLVRLQNWRAIFTRVCDVGCINLRLWLSHLVEAGASYVVLIFILWLLLLIRNKQRGVTGHLLVGYICQRLILRA